MPLVLQTQMTPQEKDAWVRGQLEAHARLLLNQVPEEPLVPPTMNFDAEDEAEPDESYFGAEGAPVMNEEPLLTPEMDFGSYE